MSQSLFDLSGAKALITGAGRGIGRTLAEGFAAAGADVVIADIDIEPAGEAKEAIEGMGRKCALIQADVTDMESAERMVVEAAAALGGLTILVNNAGTNVRKTLWDISEADWDRILDLNLKSIFFITRRAGEEMKKAGGGKVINISSADGLVGLQKPQAAVLRALYVFQERPHRTHPRFRPRICDGQHPGERHLPHLHRDGTHRLPAGGRTHLRRHLRENAHGPLRADERTGGAGHLPRFRGEQPRHGYVAPSGRRMVCHLKKENALSCS